MTFTVSDVLVEVRELIQDSTIPLRYPDEFVVRKINQIVRRMVVLRPDLFTEIVPIACVPGNLQSAPADAVRLMDVLTNNANTAVKEVSHDTLDMMVPDWRAVTGPVVNWMRFPRDQRRFYIYPAAIGGETLTLVYARCPPTLGLPSVIPLNPAYMPAVVDGTTWLMESIDAEHVESARAAMFQRGFTEMIAGGLAARRITDTDDAATAQGAAS